VVWFKNGRQAKRSSEKSKGKAPAKRTVRENEKSQNKKSYVSKSSEDKIIALLDGLKTSFVQQMRDQQKKLTEFTNKVKHDQNVL